MKIRAILFNHYIVCSVFLSVLLLSPSRSSAYDFYGWYHGAAGYKDAIQEAEYDDKPLIVYFYTESCKWSQKMNSKYLAAYEVDDFLSRMSKVEINPYKGSAEKALKDKYHVTGYPTFFVSVPSISSRNERVHPFTNDGEWTIAQFIEAVRSKIVTVYDNKGYSYYQSKEYEEAINHYDIALSFDPEDVYAYYGRGTTHYAMAYENEDSSLLEEAETDFLNALDIDPEHKESKKQLEHLQKTMEKMGLR